ncbi:MAG: tetraacyldisaccharide 4'-kinase, partial [Octadecabacter sp.]|nr:tetraacyldisaccharide 4'-kinase [Octadecabacter sp.]
LRPLGAVYAGATARRVARKPEHDASVPVICIGNINAGGTGKTPTTIAVAQRLIARGQTPHIVSRGYGGSLRGPVKVDSRQHDSTSVGDEPLLLAAFTPTWVSKDRAAGVRAAETEGASVILLDDGFQNPSVAKDLNIVVVDAVVGFGNGHVIPAGPLREPVATGLQRADLLLAIGPAKACAAFDVQIAAACGRIDGTLKPLPTGMPWQGMRALAFAGIGHPEKFFATLRSQGVDVVRGEALEDHQPLTDTLMTRLETEAKARGLNLVTTEKDAVRLPDRFRKNVLTMPVRLELDDWAPLDAKLAALGL